MIEKLRMTNQAKPRMTDQATSAEKIASLDIGNAPMTSGRVNRLFSEKKAVVVTEARKNLLSRDERDAANDFVDPVEPASPDRGKVFPASDYRNITG